MTVLELTQKIALVLNQLHRWDDGIDVVTDEAEVKALVNKGLSLCAELSRQTEKCNTLQ